MPPICAEPTWILNAHDTADLADWKGKRVSVDLGSSALSGDLAQTLVIMGDRLSPQTRKLIRDNCRRRTLEPYVQALQNGGASGMWWISSDMNWNSVCHNGVLATALAVAEDRQERAFFIACAEKFSRNYLRGFGPDGYCSEGMGYWNYGFSNYVQLAELIYQATAGGVDLYALPGAREAACYPTMAEIRQQIYPSFADCGTDSRPDFAALQFPLAPLPPSPHPRHRPGPHLPRRRHLQHPDVLLPAPGDRGHPFRQPAVPVRAKLLPARRRPGLPPGRGFRGPHVRLPQGREQRRVSQSQRPG